MSGEERLKIVIDAVNDGQDEIQGLSKDLKGVEQQTESSKGAFGGMVTSLTDVKAGFDMASQVVDKVGQALDATVGKAARWGDDMGDLAQLTGQSVEETSLMAATFELVGIKGDTLTKVLKTLAKDGINLNMRELGDLAAQYQALQDPIEKNRFLFEHFGRSAADMAEIMGRSKEELDALTASAKSSGKVIGEEAAVAAEKLNVQWAVLQQRAEGLGITVGNVAIPAINGFVDNVLEANKQTAQSTINFLENTGAISANEAALRREAVASGDVFAALVNQKTTTERLKDDTDRLTTSTGEAAVEFDTFGQAAYGAAAAAFSVAVKQQEAAKAAQDLKTAESDLAAAIAGPVGQENQKYIDQQAELRVKARDLKAELEKLEGAQGKQFTATSNSTLSANELNLAQLKLAEAQKRLAEATDPMKQAALQVEIDKLTGKIAGATTTTSGYIDNGKRIGEIKTELDGVNAAFDENAKKHEEATARIVFGFIQQRLAADGLQDGEITTLAEIGKAWGIYDQDTANALAAVDQSIKEHGANAKAIIGDVGAAIEGLPDVKSIEIQVHTNGMQIGSEDFGGWMPPKGSGKPPKTVTTTNDNTDYGGQQAEGGDYWVTKPTWFLAGEAGPERATFTPAGQTMNMGGITINVSGAGDPQAVAREVSRILAAQVRGLGAAGASVLGR